MFGNLCIKRSTSRKCNSKNDGAKLDAYGAKLDTCNFVKNKLQMDILLLTN